MRFIYLYVILFIASSSILLRRTEISSGTTKAYTLPHVVASFGKQYKDGNVTAPFVYPANDTNGCSEMKTNLTGLITMVIESKTTACTPSVQAMNAEEAGSVGVVIMKKRPESYWDDYYIDFKKEENPHNVSIPVVGVIYYSDLEELMRDSAYSSVVVISKETEYSPVSVFQYIVVLAFLLLVMWGGFAFMYLLAKISLCLKKNRRKGFVKQIKSCKYHARDFKDLENQSCCSVCLCEFQENESIKKLRCNHVFHDSCIDPWLINQKAVCPICRQGVYKRDDWNLLEEGQSRDIDIILNRIEQTSPNTFSNVFVCIFCIFVIIYPFIMAFV